MNAIIHGERRLSLWEAAGLIFLFLTVGVWGAAVTATAIVAGAQQFGGALGNYLQEAGADRIMRRCLMGWAALFIVVLLWRGGWRGWRDCGFTAADPDLPERPWWANILIGISLGLILLGGLSLLTISLHLRIVTPVASVAEGIHKAMSFIGSGITVALIEETVCRGMLFRVLARSWKIWPAAVLSSMLFAMAHFLSPDPLSFKGAAFFQTSFNVFASTYAQAVKTPSGLLVFVNLSLLGIVFCGFVVRTRTIWLAVGSHAALVWAVKSFHWWTEVAPEVRPLLWLGTRSDFMDSIAVTMLMTVLIVLGFRRRRPADAAVCYRGCCWSVAPEDRTSLRAWFERYYTGDVAQGASRYWWKTYPAPRPREDCKKSGHLALSGSEKEKQCSSLEEPGPANFKGCTVLKDHHGSRVIALGGLVVKSYSPKAGWTRFRFALRPSRARRAFLIGHALLTLGIPTPRPMAWTVLRRFGLLRGESLIVLEAVGCERLTDCLARDEHAPAERAHIMAAYGHITAMFHRAGYSNRDMKHDNIMCSIREPWQLQVIDLDGVRHLRWISRRRAGRDLMRVGQSLASLGRAGQDDLRAFFEAYNAELPSRLHRQDFPPENGR